MTAHVRGDSQDQTQWTGNQKWAACAIAAIGAFDTGIALLFVLLGGCGFHECVTHNELVIGYLAVAVRFALTIFGIGAAGHSAKGVLVWLVVALVIYLAMQPLGDGVVFPIVELGRYLIAG